MVTSDITKGNTKLQLQSHIVHDTDTLGGLLLVDPPSLEFAPEDRGRVLEVTVTNVSEEPIAPTLVSAPYNVFDVDFSDKAIGPGESTKMTVKVLNDTRLKTAKRSFTFEFDDPKRTRFSLPVALVLKKSEPVKPTEATHSGGGK